MQHILYPDNWKQRSHTCIEQAGRRCQQCGAPLGALRLSRKYNLYFLPLHASHINHDPWNPDAELRALCPSCHAKTHKGIKGKRGRARSQGYQTIPVSRLVAQARSAGLFITQEESGCTWSLGDLSGTASDVLDALGSALHCLIMERMKGQA
jgi:hypothetical protein